MHFFTHIKLKQIICLSIYIFLVNNNCKFEERVNLIVNLDKEVNWMANQRKKGIDCTLKEGVNQPHVIIHLMMVSQKKKS